MSEVVLKNVKKIYPNSASDTKKKKKAKKGEEAPAEENKVNLQITDKGVVAVQEFNIDIKDKEFIVLVGPSGCGKSTFLRCLNRMNDLIPNVKITGSLLYRGEDIYAPGQDVTDLRKRIGMVFQKANPFPMSIYDNVAYGPRTHGIRSKVKLDEIVEESLKSAAI